MTAKTGTRGYCVTFKVIEGEHTGRRLWKTLWNTKNALPYTKRDLKKLGIDTEEKLKRPLPAERFVCKLSVVIRAGNDGIERNETANFELLRVQEPPADAFAPPLSNPPAPASAAGKFFPDSPNAGKAEKQ